VDDALGDLIATLGSVDHEAIDWANVLRTTALIHQHFRYEYPGPVTELRQRLMVVPPDFHDGQRLLTHKIRVSGCNVDTERSYDTFGNVILDFSLERVEQSVDFTAWIVVEREASVDGSDEPDPLSPDARLGEPSRLTEPDAALEAVAAELRADGVTGVELAERIAARVHEHFTYRYGQTTVSSTAAEAWAGGLGVCQDYAHCMLALCRLCGLPARYVSGHLLGEGGTHAWVEVLVPHPTEDDALRAVAIDPTHDRRAGLKYLSVAVGRDYADVPPTSGTFEAPYAGQLTTHKRAAVTRVEYLRPRRRRRGRAPVQ
jgi:transglutaminase-like putative cysteine protease